MVRPGSAFLVAVLLGGCHMLLPLSSNEDGGALEADAPSEAAIHDLDGSGDAHGLQDTTSLEGGRDLTTPDQGPPDKGLQPDQKPPPPPPPGSCIWSRSFGGTSTVVGVSVAAGAGLVCAAGYFKGTADFGKGSVNAKGIFDIFVVCTDPLGQVKWAKTFGTSGTEAYARAVTVDATGNVFITGFFSGSLNLGGGPLNSTNGSWDILAAGFGPTGTLLWSKHFGAKKDDWGYGATVDDAGGLWLTGHFADQVDFGGGPLSAQSSTSIFIVKLATQTGAHLLSMDYGAQIDDRGFWAATGPGGSVSVTGFFSKTVDFGGGPLTSTSPKLDALLVSLSSSGGHLWSIALGGKEVDRGEGLAVDSLGNVYATGRFSAKADFKGATLTSAGSYDVFLASYDTGGGYRWAKRLGGTLFDGGRSVSVGQSDHVFAVGYFEGTASFDGASLTSKGDRDVFVTSFDSAGKHRWSKRFGAFGEDEGHGVIAGSSGLFVTGKFQNTVNFGCAKGPLASKGGDDVFIVRLAP